MGSLLRFDGGGTQVDDLLAIGSLASCTIWMDVSLPPLPRLGAGLTEVDFRSGMSREYPRGGETGCCCDEGGDRFPPRDMKLSLPALDPRE